jgi:hypothetical protein
MKNPVPFKFYTETIPYLLISKGKDGATATIFYLKDPKSAYYAQQHQGWGTANFTMALSNGVLTSYGMQTDSKGPETITAVSSLLSSATGVLTGAGVLKAQSSADYTGDGQTLEDAASAFNASVAPLPLKNDAQTQVQSLVTSIGEVASAFKKPGFSPVTTDGQSQLAKLAGSPELLGRLSGATALTSADPSKIKDFDDAKGKFSKALKTVITDIFGATVSDNPFQLFEIREDENGHITLIPVKVPKA